MDELAKLYIMKNAYLYRIKVFQNTIGIERQEPYEDNVLFQKADYPVCIGVNTAHGQLMC